MHVNAVSGSGSLSPVGSQRRLSYRTVWRWHFYAGLICLPFVIFLSITGGIYLFQPEIDAWLDDRYAHLTWSGPRSTAAAQVAAAVAAVPGGTLNSYQVPESPTAAVQVLVGHGKELYRTWVHPGTLEVLKVSRDDLRFTRFLFYLHGELFAGTAGSVIIETVSSWTVVMIATGVFLWWPRKRRGMAGVAYPRLSKTGRVFWRDLHAVSAVWVSLATLFFILSGLPWAASWGGMLKVFRENAGESVAKQDWTTGSLSELTERVEMNTPLDADEHAAHQGMTALAPGTRYGDVDRVLATVNTLSLASPVLIAPPSKADPLWNVQSKAENRIDRTRLEFDGGTGRILAREDFAERPLIDRAVGVGVALHVGQLFPPLNQWIDLAVAAGLIAASLSALVLWWRRRPAHVLGAMPTLDDASVPRAAQALMLLMCVLMPLLGVTLIAIIVLERLVFRRVPAVAAFLGLDPVHAHKAAAPQS